MVGRRFLNSVTRINRLVWTIIIFRKIVSDIVDNVSVSHLDICGQSLLIASLTEFIAEII